MSDDLNNLNVRAAFTAIEAREAAAIFERLHERVAIHRGRVEITRGGRDGNGDLQLNDSCVLISKAELDSLEQAIEILSNTDSAAAMRDELTRIAAQLNEVPEAASP